jgi:hypothetical protein
MTSTQRIMTVILLEVPAAMPNEAIVSAGASLRQAFGAQAGMPPGMAPARVEDPPKTVYSCSTGKRFSAAPGCQFLRLEVRLAHPVTGGGSDDFDIAEKVVEFAIHAYGASRALFGSTGVAESGMQERFEARFWSPESAAKLRAISTMYRPGPRWRPNDPDSL